MNQDDKIQDIWRRMEPDKKEVTMEAVEQAMRSSVNRQSIGMKLYIWFWLAWISATLLLAGMNIAGYAGNPPFQWAQIAIATAAVAFGAYGVHLLNEVTAMDRADESMTTLLKRRIRFYRSKYEIWNLMSAALCFMLTFVIGCYVDNDHGTYRINRPWFFGTVAVLQFLIVYAALKIGQYPLLKETRIFLSDLEAQAFEGMSRLPELRRHWRRWSILLTAIFLVLLLLGIWQAMRTLR